MQMVSETWHLFTSELSVMENKLGNFNIPGGERRWQTSVPEKLVLLFFTLTPRTGRLFCLGQLSSFAK